MSAYGPQHQGIGVRRGKDARLAEAVNSGIPRPGLGNTHTSLPGGTVIRSNPRLRRVIPLHPFFCNIVSSNSTTAVRIQPGWYNGVPPLVGSTPLTTPLNLPVDPFGTIHIMLMVIYALSASAGGYVHGATEAFRQINAFALIPDNAFGPSGPDSAVFYIPLATFTNGIRTAQYVTSSLSGEVCDLGLQDGTAGLTVDGVVDPN